MVNDAVDESGGVKKKPSCGKVDSSATGSGSVAGETSGFRRATRSQSNSSPSSVRKSQRLEKQTEMTSPLTRSARPGKDAPSTNKGGSKLRNNKAGLRKDKIVKGAGEGGECKVGDKTSKENSEMIRDKEKEGSSPKVGDKRKKRMDARHFKAMFQLRSAETSESKKRRLDNSSRNADSGVRDLGEGISENCENDVDSDPLKSKEGLQVTCNEHGDSGLGNPDEELQENSDEDAKRSIEDPDEDEEPQECSDGEEMKEECAINTDNGTEGQYLAMNKNICVEKPSEVKDGDGQQVYERPNLSSPSGSPSLKTSLLPRLNHDFSKHDLCRCLSNSMRSANFVSVSKDRGQCSDAADEDDQKTNRSDLLVGADQGSCVICKRAGNLLRCGGKSCQRSYHPSCIWTHEDNAYIPIWYFSECMKKNLALGTQSESEGIESIFDAREVELSNSEGSRKEKQYFVKYKGLAHIHNCWIAETELLHEAPELLEKFSKQNKSWKPEWAVPHRLLLRRSIIADQQDANFASENHDEWLVKWRGLDYDQATWELEDSEIFKKPEAQLLLKEFETRQTAARSSFQQLLKEYETRQNEAKNSSMSGDNKNQERKIYLNVKHGRLSDSLQFESVNKLREFHQKRHNAVLFEEQDRALKIFYFISSILSSVRRPFLIISPRESMSYWEAEFLRLTSSINVVVYGGNTYSRKIIRSLEFYGEGGEVMLQVLLSSVEAISEDIKELKGMDWEAVIVDDCQEPRMLGYSACIKTLVTNWKLLLFNTQLKDTISEYINILSLLEPVGSSDEGQTDASNKDINALKERLCSFIISPRFQEYWVPVEISNVQLEQYCSLLLSNSAVLSSCSKSDQIGSLHNVLISTQKCCDHPYLVNPLLRQFLLPEHPPQGAALDMGVKASGKLQLLDELLSKFRSQGLKTLILFQPVGGSGKDNLDIILDDFLTWRFGEDSYEHVAAGGLPSTKNAALNKFNREKDRSFLLLETRACTSFIKLSIVDTVIVLNSDWNPLNDVRALQKIMIDSKLKPIHVFRFYCSCTVEEKALIIAKNYTIPENTRQSSPSIKQMLLMWGCSYLFSRLDEFHRDKVLDYRDNIAFGSSFMTGICQEIVSLVQNHGNVNPTRYISLARQDGRCYFTTIPLLGEQRTQLEEGVSSNAFWVKLLDGMQPQWKYLSKSSERNRKRVQYSVELSLPRNVQTDETSKKRKDYSPRRAGQNPGKIKERNKENNGLDDVRIVQQDDRKNLLEQRGLFDMLNPTVLRLCETLMLKDEVKRLAARFLEFVLNNHHVTREPETILQAFQISVCWIAAEVLEKKIDHDRSLGIARDKMNFKCLDQEADSLYSKMKLLMKIFLSRNMKVLKSPIDPASTEDDISVLNENCVNVSIGSLDKITAGLDVSSFAADGFNKKVLPQMDIPNNVEGSMENADRLKKKCEKKIKRLKEKQNDELIDFENFWEKTRLELEDTYKLESALIRYSHANYTALVDKLKILDNDYATKRRDLERKVSNLRKEIEAKQQEERDGEQQKIAQLLKLVTPMAQDEHLEKPQLLNSTQFQTTEAIGTAGETTEVTSQMDTVLDKPASPESNRGDGTSTLSYCVSAEQLQPPVSTFMQQQTADETSGQGLGHELSQQRAEEVKNRDHTPSDISGTSPRCETSLDPANLVPANLPRDGRTSVVPTAELSFPMSVGYDLTRGASSSQLNNQPTEDQVSILNSCTQMPLSVVASTVDANIGRGPLYVSATGGASIAHASPSNPVLVGTPTISRGSVSFHSDPLQNEYDRMRKEIGGIINSHEEMKLRLRSECDKEIEELVAQIRRKYDAKLEEAESSFSLKKMELEMNQHMVMMNKFLADALRSKCTDYKGTTSGGTQKGPSSSSKGINQPPTRPFPVAGSSSGIWTASNQDNTPLPAGGVLPGHGVRASAPHVAHSASHLAHMSVPPAISSQQPLSGRENPNLSFSALELPNDTARQNEPIISHLSDNLPALPDNLQSLDSWDLSQFESVFDAQQPTLDVVCLSDDD